MPKVHFVKKAAKDNSVVKKGEPYYWWKFRYGGRRMSKDYPPRHLLTQSSFLSQLYQLQDGVYTTQDDVESLISDLETLRDECQDSLDNMPESLQESSESGVLLQERIDGLEEWISNLEGIDFHDLEEQSQGDEEQLSDLISEAVGEADPGI